MVGAGLAKIMAVSEIYRSKPTPKCTASKREMLYNPITNNQPKTLL
jgi:hypothetical protein